FIRVSRRFFFEPAEVSQEALIIATYAFVETTNNARAIDQDKLRTMANRLLRRGIFGESQFEAFVGQLVDSRLGAGEKKPALRSVELLGVRPQNFRGVLFRITGNGNQPHIRIIF